MKRTLAPEALYSSDHYDSNSEIKPEDSDQLIIDANHRRKVFDPNGERGLALLREIENQRV